MLAQIGRFSANNRIYHLYVPCWHTSVIHGWKAVENADFWVNKVLGHLLFYGNFMGIWEFCLHLIKNLAHYLWH